MDKHVNEATQYIYTKHLLFEKRFYNRETIKKVIVVSPLAKISLYIMIG